MNCSVFRGILMGEATKWWCNLGEGSGGDSRITQIDSREWVMRVGAGWNLPRVISDSGLWS
jgi:hypothetical protein